MKKKCVIFFLIALPVCAHEAYILKGGDTTKEHIEILSHISRNTHEIRFSEREHSFVFFYDENFNFVKKEIIAIGDSNSVSVPKGKIAALSKKYSAPVVIVGHNHPGGDKLKKGVIVGLPYAAAVIWRYPSREYCRPSKSDTKHVYSLKRHFAKHDVILLDNVILTGHHLYSFRIHKPFIFRDHHPNILKRLKEVKKK